MQCGTILRVCVCVCVPWSGWADQVSSVGFKRRDVVTLGPLQRHKDTISDRASGFNISKQTQLIQRNACSFSTVPHHVSGVTGSQVDSFLTERLQQTDTCTWDRHLTPAVSVSSALCVMFVHYIKVRWGAPDIVINLILCSAHQQLDSDIVIFQRASEWSWTSLKQVLKRKSPSQQIFQLHHMVFLRWRSMDGWTYSFLCQVTLCQS